MGPQRVGHLLGGPTLYGKVSSRGHRLRQHWPGPRLRLDDNERTELVAADITPSARDEFGEEFGVSENERYADFREMVEQEKPDIVSVCLWHGQHASTVIAVAALQPKLIICEKPMATSLGEAEQMIVAASRNKVRLAIGHQRRFLPGWNIARDLVADGAIGPVTHLWSNVADGLLNWGTHTIDMMRFIMGDPAATAVVGAVQRHSTGTSAACGSRTLPRPDPVRERRPGDDPERSDAKRDGLDQLQLLRDRGRHPGRRERRQADERLHQRLEGALHLGVEGLVPRRLPGAVKRHRGLAGRQGQTTGARRRTPTPSWRS